MKKISRFTLWLIIMCAIILTGVLGFMLVEGYGFLDAVYMTVITLSTIGYGETKTLSESGKIFNICFIIFSFSVFTYALTNLTRFVVSGDMATYFKKRRLMKAIEKFSNHVIICGFGRHGQQAAQILQDYKIDFVVIDNAPAHMESWHRNDMELVYIVGDATSDETLMKAGLPKAKALLLTLPTDADNVFIVLSARAISKKVVIISKAQAKSTVVKLKSAGADHIILPEVLGGTHMATLVSKPDVIEFINNLWGDDTESTNIESVAFEDLPKALQGKTIEDIIAWQDTGVNCLGVKDQNGKFQINPPREMQMRENMKILLFGTMSQIAAMKLHFKNGNIK